MSAIIKIVKFSKQLQIKPTNPCFINSVRTAVMHRDWKPAPFPKTLEERKKSAEKYNMHLDEYKPHPEGDLAALKDIGDYPELPSIGFDAKDPYYPWDVPGDRRNYNETLPEDFHVTGGETNSEAGMRKKYTDWDTIRICVGYFGGVTLLLLWGNEYQHFKPISCQQYPGPGVKHYTFEQIK